MAKKLTKEQFIEKARQIHGDKYGDYAKVEYVNSRTKVCIVCPKHGEFWQTPSNHLKGQGCPICGYETVSIKLFKDTNLFIERAKEIHNNKYDYSKTIYKGCKEDLIVTCPIHGDFEITPNEHLNRYGCPKCRYKTVAEKLFLGIEEFTRRANIIHNNKYDYSKVVYVNISTKICIICPVHGEFWQTPKNHLNGQGCAKCGRLSMIAKEQSNAEDFIRKSNIIHNNKYSYEHFIYINNHTKGWITCPIHGDFLQKPNAHLNGCGCPICNESHLEKETSIILDNNKIVYERFKRFDWLGKQSLDFYLSEYHVAIECQGRQHFMPIKAFGDEEGFQKCMERDKKKNKLCKENNINLFYINYDEDIKSKVYFIINEIKRNN